MSTKVELAIFRYLDIELLEKGVKFWIIRTKTQIRLKTKIGFTQVFDGMIDTGSSISLIPQKIWEDIEYEVITENIMRGIIPKEDCFLPVKVAKVTGILLDSAHESNPMSFRAYLVPSDKVPLLIGVDSLLARSMLHVDYVQKKGYIEIEG